MEAVVQKVKKEYAEFAKESTLKVTGERGGYRLDETMKNGNTGVTMYFKDGELEAFNHGWKMETESPKYLGDACYNLIKILDKNNIPTGSNGVTLGIKSKKYRTG